MFLPRTKARWCGLVVAIIAAEAGLIAVILISNGVNVRFLSARAWLAGIGRLAALHTLAFLPAVVAFLIQGQRYRGLRIPRLRIPRMSTRRWLVAVPVIGLAVFLFTRSNRNREIADYHSIDPIIWSGPQEAHDRLMTRLRWEYEMEKKYRRAAWYPWLPIAPDPPEPAMVKVVDYFRHRKS